MLEPNEQDDHYSKAVDDTIATLKQAGFDTVQIFVSKEASPEDISLGRNQGDTLTLTNGIGNFNARFGQTYLWLKSVELDHRPFIDPDYR